MVFLTDAQVRKVAVDGQDRLIGPGNFIGVIQIAHALVRVFVPGNHGKSVVLCAPYLRFIPDLLGRILGTAIDFDFQRIAAIAPHTVFRVRIDKLAPIEEPGLIEFREFPFRHGHAGKQQRHAQQHCKEPLHKPSSCVIHPCPSCGGALPGKPAPHCPGPAGTGQYPGARGSPSPRSGWYPGRFHPPPAACHGNGQTPA